MNREELIQDINKKLVELTLLSLDKKAEIVIANFKYDLIQNLNLCINTLEKLQALKKEFQLKRELFLKTKAWELFTPENIPVLIEHIYEEQLKMPSLQLFIDDALKQFEKNSVAQLRVEFKPVLTDELIKQLTFKDKKNGKTFLAKDILSDEKFDHNKFKDEIGKKYSAFTLSNKYSVDLNTIVVYVSDHFFDTVIIPERNYIEINVPDQNRYLVNGIALSSFLNTLKSDIEIIEKLQLNETPQLERQIQNNKNDKANQSTTVYCSALDLTSKKYLENGKINELKKKLVEGGFIEEINGNTFKVAFSGVIAKPEINWIQPNGKTKGTISKLLYFIYLLIDINHLVKEPKEKFNVLSNCFLVNGEMIETDKNSLSSLYNQLKEKYEFDKSGKEIWMSNLEKIINETFAIKKSPFST